MGLLREMEPENRFAHLLRPIRDLSENWNIDIAKYLEDYLQEIEGITVSFDNGANIMNFAEAALVIQGSACVYSKKVEYLYKLVYQTLNMISSKKQDGIASSVDAQGRDADVSAHTDSAQKFLTLDDIKESNNIDMVEYAGKEHNISMLPRTPLALIPLQDAEKHGSTLKSRTGELLGRKQDYKMNTSSIHSSGALLLEPINRIYPDGKPVLSGKRPPIPPLQLDTPLATIATVTNDAMEIDDGGLDMDMGGGYYSDNNDHTTPKSTRWSTRKGGIRMMLDESTLQDNEPLLLDPHQANSTPNKPFQKGNTIRIPASLQGKGKKGKTKKTAQLEPLAEFLLRTFYSCYMQFPKQQMKKPLYPEFEAQYWQHQQHIKNMRKKEAQKLKSLQKESVAAQLQDAVEGVGLEEEGQENGFIPLSDIPEYDDNNAATDGYYDNNIDDQYIDAAISSHDPTAEYQSQIAENLNIVQSYEDVVRNYVEKTLESAMTYAVETELSSRVRQWERRIRPILEEEELRGPFDIHKYGGEILNEFDRHQTDNRMSFKTISQDKDVHDVCRMFLASLQLANNYNIEIDGKDEEEVMWMKLLSRQLPHEAMEEFRAPSLQTAHSTSK